MRRRLTLALAVFIATAPVDAQSRSEPPRWPGGLVDRMRRAYERGDSPAIADRIVEEIEGRPRLVESLDAGLLWQVLAAPERDGERVQAIGAAHLLMLDGRPEEALSALRRLRSNVLSDAGEAAVAAIRVGAAVQLSNRRMAEDQLRLLTHHRQDLPAALEPASSALTGSRTRLS